MSTDLPPSSRARQWWDDMPRTQRVNRLLYGLALVSMLGLLVELGLGSPQTDVDLATDSADRNRNPTTTRPASPASSVLTDSPPTLPGGLSLADILSQITVPSIPEADAGATGTEGAAGGSGGRGGGDVPAPARTTATTAAPRSQPSGGGGGGGSPTPAAPAPAPKSAPAQSNPPADPDQPASPTTPPSQPTQTTPTTAAPTTTTVAPTMPKFPEISIPTPTTTCGRRCP